MCFRTKQNQKNMLQEHKGVDKDGASFQQGCHSIKHSTQWVKPAHPATWHLCWTQIHLCLTNKTQRWKEVRKMTKDGDTKVYGCSGNVTTSSTVTSILIHQVLWKGNRPNKDAPVNHHQESWQQLQESVHKEHETKKWQRTMVYCSEGHEHTQNCSLVGGLTLRLYIIDVWFEWKSCQNLWADIWLGYRENYNWKRNLHPLSIKFWDWVCKKYKIQPHN
jgi:hypothetical protein